MRKYFFFVQAPLPSHDFLPIFLPVGIRHAQHIDACGDVAHTHRGGSALLGRTCVCARHHPPLQVVQGDGRDACAGEFNVEEVIGGVRIDRQRGVFGLRGLGLL